MLDGPRYALTTCPPASPYGTLMRGDDLTVLLTHARDCGLPWLQTIDLITGNAKWVVYDGELTEVVKQVLDEA